MDIVRSSLFGLAVTMLTCSLATAGDMSSLTVFQGFRPVVSLQGGYASVNAENNSERFAGTDSDVFTYAHSGSGRDTGFMGVFLGAEHTLPGITVPGFFMDAGIEYNYFGSIRVSGTNTAGVEQQTLTTYQYNYTFQTQQLLGIAKLFATTYERFHPYVEVGLGAAFNQTGQYQATTAQTGSLNLTPGFSNQRSTQFSYSLGLGVDTQVNTNWRVGIGYRYSNFGSSSLGNGAVTFNQYQSSVPFSLGRSNVYDNQLIARITYLA